MTDRRPDRSASAPKATGDFAYHVVDVFTDVPLAGNPLAVVLDAAALSAERRQAIAREFNLSETVFVGDPRDPVNTARVHIHTAQRELPFAGHPTVGTAALLAHLRAPEIIAREDLAVVLEETVGPVDCIVRRVGGRLSASFTLPRLPECLDPAPPTADALRALGLEAGDVGFDEHAPTVFSAGVAFLCLPLRPGAIGRIRALAGAPASAGAPLGTYLYSRDVERGGSAYRARMIGSDFGGAEDPATGSAAAALAGAIVRFERPADGDHTLVIEQGFEMGRPSLITLGLVIEDGRLKSGSIGGGVVPVAQGSLRL